VARELDPRQWARLYAAIPRSATRRPRARGARRRRGSHR
jgi:hypothetical protein